MMPTTSAASTPSRNVTISASNMGRPSGSHGQRRRRRKYFRGFLGAGVAEAGDLQRVVGGHEAVGPADLRLERHDARAHELDHPPAARAHEMVVLLPGMNVL